MTRENEPDFEAVQRIALAYFGLHFESFLALPPEALVRIMDMAGVERSRIGGVIEALRSLRPEDVCRKLMN